MTTPGFAVEVVDLPGQIVIEVGVGDAPIQVEVIAPGPQGPPGDTRVWIGDTPPEDNTMLWANTQL